LGGAFPNPNPDKAGQQQGPGSAQKDVPNFLFFGKKSWHGRRITARDFAEG